MHPSFISRYLQPPSTWIACVLESRELLGLCLKRLKGLNKVHLVDAGFVWTEPHSKRLKVKLTIQKEVSNIRQVFTIYWSVSGIDINIVTTSVCSGIYCTQSNM